MQPSNSLILLGITIVAASAIGVSAAAAEPGMRHPRSSAAEGEATSASSTSDAVVTSTPPSAAAKPDASQPVPAPTDARPSWQSSPSQKRQSFKAQVTTGEERLDQLQRDSVIRQRRNETRDNSFDRPLAPESNPLQVEQDIERLLNAPSPSSGNPDQRLDRLQYEQRVRQQLRQQNRSPAPEPAPTPEPEPLSQDSLPTEAELVAAEPEQAESAEPEQTAALSQLRPNKGAAKNQEDAPIETAQEEPDQANETSTPTNAETTEQASPDNEQPVEDASNSDADSDTDSDAASSDAAKQEESAQTEVEADEAELEGTEPVEADEAEPNETEPDEIEASQSPAPVETPPALQDAPTPTQPLLLPDQNNPNPTVPPILEDAEQQRRNSIDTDNRSFTDDSPAPEYLDPDPNPLTFPTLPEEVEIVGTQPITLKQAVELALRNNAELRQAQLTLERTQAELRETQSANFPTLGANANFNQQGSESASRQPETNFLGQPNPDAGDITVTYGDSTTLGAGLQLDYTIFTSGRRSALIDAARGQVRLQQLELERQIEQLIFDTATNYYDLQEAGAQVNIFSANLAQAEQSLRDAQALERAGVGTRFDVLQAEVEVANARQDLTQQLSELEIARRELAQQINISEALDIAAADPIEVTGVWDLSLEESIVQAYKNRVELEQSLIQREVAQRNRRAALAQLGPQVGVSGAFNVVNDFDNDFTFLHNYQLGLTVTQSLYDGGQARAQANQQEANIAIAESEFENRREQIRFEVERAYSQLDANFANIQTTALAVEQAAEALRLARLRFQAGVGTQTDVLRQQTELARSQVNNLSAILSYNRAIVALERAVSNYPEGYLNEVP